MKLFALHEIKRAHIYHCTYDVQVYSNERIHKSGERDFNIFYAFYFNEICTEENVSCTNIHPEQRYETWNAKIMLL